MAAVAAIYITRTLLSLTALKVYMIILAVWGIARLVWVSRVVENFYTVEQSGAAAAGRFLLAAVSHAQLGVQIALLIMVIAGVSLLLDISRAGTTRGSFAG